MPKLPKVKRIKVKDEIFLVVTIAFVVILLSLSALNIRIFLNKPNVDNKNEETKVLGYEDNNTRRINYWINFLNANPSYLPGWVEIAKLAKQLNQTEIYENALVNIKEIDPNSEQLKVLE